MDIVADRVSRNVISNSMNKIIRNNEAANRQKKKKNRMQTEIMANGAVNDMVDNAVEQSSATTIQSALRNRKAKIDMMNQRQ